MAAWSETATRDWEQAVRREWTRQDFRAGLGLCPICGCAEHTATGNLGVTYWVRCRDCGAEIHRRAER